MTTRPLKLGMLRQLSTHATEVCALPPHHLTTHGVIVGMTGSGKTGLATVLVEETLRSRVPVLLLDVKGDLSNLLLTPSPFDPAAYEPWIDPEAAARDDRSPADLASDIVARRRADFAPWGFGPEDVARFRACYQPRVITPGSDAGEALDVLSALDRPSPAWAHDPESALHTLTATVSLVLRLLDRDPDPARSRDHVVLTHLARARLARNQPADLPALIADLLTAAPVSLGAMPLDDYMPERDRRALATALNTLLASPSFAAWRKGTALDVGAWLAPPTDPSAPTPAVILSVAHLDDDERALLLGLVFEHLLAWVRTLPGSNELRALIVFDEAYGFLPPHPANPPAKRPLVALLKQSRAFGVGLVIATQNPMDLDYRALSNAGVWWVGRLQTDADRRRVVEGLAGCVGASGIKPDELARVIKSLPPRTFVMRDVHRDGNAGLLTTRSALCWLRGPMTRAEIMRAGRESNDPGAVIAEPAA